MQAPDFDIQAEHEIKKVLLRYCRAIDRCDAELLRSCYVAGADEDHGSYKGDSDGFVKWAIDGLRARSASHNQVTTHVLGNMLVEVKSEEAMAETYFTASHVEDREEHFRIFVLHGRYLDRFTRLHGAWLISSRRVVHDWSEVREGRRGLRPGSHSYVQGLAGTDDLVYSYFD